MIQHARQETSDPRRGWLCCAVWCLVSTPLPASASSCFRAHAHVLFRRRLLAVLPHVARALEVCRLASGLLPKSTQLQNCSCVGAARRGARARRLHTMSRWRRCRDVGASWGWASACVAAPLNGALLPTRCSGERGISDRFALPSRPRLPHSMLTSAASRHIVHSSPRSLRRLLWLFGVLHKSFSVLRRCRCHPYCFAACGRSTFRPV